MRILQISSSYPPSPGGVATHVANLSQGLIRNKRNIVTVLTSSQNKKSTYPKLGRGRLQIWKFGLEEIPNFYGRRTPLEDVILFCMNKWNIINPEIIHAHDFDSAYIGLMLKNAFGVPVVFTNHRAPTPWKENKYKEDPKDCFLEAIRKLDIIDKIIVPSKKSRQILLDMRFGKRKIKIIRHGVSYKYLSSFSDNEDIQNEFKSKFVILCPIRADEHKSPEIILRTAPVIIKKNPSINFIFVITEGLNSVSSLLLDYSKLLNLKVGKDIIFRRFERDEMPTLFRLSKICIVPSIRESFGQAVIESFIFKTPVVVANSSALKEIVRHGTNGLKFSTNSVKDLSEQIQKLIDDKKLYMHLVKNGLKDVEFKYDAKRMVRQYYSLYKSITRKYQK